MLEIARSLMEFVEAGHTGNHRLKQECAPIKPYFYFRSERVNRPLAVENGNFRTISSCLRSWSGDHIRFSAVSPQLDGLRYAKDARSARRPASVYRAIFNSCDPLVY